MTIAQGRRIAVILDPEVDSAVQRIVAHTKQPVATFVREILLQGVPAFKAMADALDVVDKSPARAVGMMVRQFDKQTWEAQQEVLPLRRKRGRKPKE